MVRNAPCDLVAGAGCRVLGWWDKTSALATVTSWRPARRTERRSGDGGPRLQPLTRGRVERLGEVGRAWVADLPRLLDEWLPVVLGLHLLWLVTIVVTGLVAQLLRPRRTASTVAS